MPSSVEADDITGEPTYWIQDPVRRQIDRSQIFHLQALNGEAPLMQVKEAIALSLIMEQHQSRLFANGAKPAGMLRLKGRLNPQRLNGCKPTSAPSGAACPEPGKP